MNYPLMSLEKITVRAAGFYQELNHQLALKFGSDTGRFLYGKGLFLHPDSAAQLSGISTGDLIKTITPLDTTAELNPERLKIIISTWAGKNAQEAFGRKEELLEQLVLMEENGLDFIRVIATVFPLEMIKKSLEIHKAQNITNGKNRLEQSLEYKNSMKAPPRQTF